MQSDTLAWRYRVISLILLPFWLLHASWLALRYRSLDYLTQRLGFSQPNRDEDIWIHASSVGEVALVKPLIESLYKHYPLHLTTFTITGYLHARAQIPGISISVLPIDFWPISRHFMRASRPKLGLIAETELWPETLYQAKRAGVKLLQINARLSKKTVDAPALLLPVLKQTLGYFDLVLTRSDSDKANFLQMGVAADKLLVAGNLKFAASSEQQEYPCLIERPYLLFASTHQPEELCFAELRKEFPQQPLWVLAPRHPKRADEILRSLKPLHLNIAQRSTGQPIDDTTDIYLADTLGELKALMAHAHLVVMGGSFNNTGGHNLLEPAALGKAVITGPSDSNICNDIEYLQSHQAILQVSDIDQLKLSLEQLLARPEQIEQMAQAAQHAVQEQASILTRYLDLIHQAHGSPVAGTANSAD